jgi:pimeloyl-ACP methyl ester carboxylesterase
MTGQNIIRFAHDGLSVDVAMTVTGSGPSILLLPALSSISIREEMTGLAQHLSQDFRVHAVDWPGFGTAPQHSGRQGRRYHR